jgi:hypothetical protein
MGMMGSAAAGPDAYVEALSGWQRDCVTVLRAAIIAAAPFDQVIKWHDLVFDSNGPCILVHTEETRILLGFWRGKRLAHLDRTIKPSGKYELGNITLLEGTPIGPADITRLAVAVAELNAKLGDPTARA